MMNDEVGASLIFTAAFFVSTTMKREIAKIATV